MQGLLLCDWLRSIENDPSGTILSKEEQRAVNLIKELLSEADIAIREGERLSAATLRVWAGTFDDVWVWGSTSPPTHTLIAVTPMLANGLRRFADEIQNLDTTSQFGKRDTFTHYSFTRLSPSTPFIGV
jgi:hypothetical protein